jgi:hypothetical protein
MVVSRRASEGLTTKSATFRVGDATGNVMPIGGMWFVHVSGEAPRVAAVKRHAR